MKGHYQFGDEKPIRESNDFYATDPKVIDDLIASKIFHLDTTSVFPIMIWENSCGDGVLVKRLRALTGSFVEGTDLVDRANGEFTRVNFLKDPGWFEKTHGVKPKFIITNPPYKPALEWLEKSMQSIQEDGRVILLLKLIFLEGGAITKRYEYFNETKNLEYVLVFSSRVNIYRGGPSAMFRKKKVNGKMVDDKTKPLSYGDSTSNTTAYAWFIWNPQYNGDPKIKWVPYNGFSENNNP